MPPDTDTDIAAADSAPWEGAIASLLAELSGVQGDLLALLDRKRRLIAAGDGPALRGMAPEEDKLAERLMACHRRRQTLLADAGRRGLPSGSLQALTASLPRAGRGRLAPNLGDARRKARLLQHQSLTNWVLVQRTLLHLSQMIEIIATGGRMRPTYGDNAAPPAGGSIVDQAA